MYGVDARLYLCNPSLVPALFRVGGEAVTGLHKINARILVPVYVITYVATHFLMFAIAFAFLLLYTNPCLQVAQRRTRSSAARGQNNQQQRAIRIRIHEY